MAVHTRPDLAYSVGKLSRYMSCPTADHLQLAYGVLRYVAGSVDVGITLGGKPNETLKGYCDADYAADKDSGKSTSGYVFTLHGGAISWSSRLQSVVAVSTTESEYLAAGAAVKEALWLTKLMSTLRVDVQPVDIFCDNMGTIAILKNPIASQRSKHIAVHHHFARERVARGEVAFHYIPTANQVADVMTYSRSEGAPGGACKALQSPPCC